MRTPSTAVRAGDRIRTTAAQLFYQRGIRAVGVDELVTRAHATKPSLYRSFVSKDELVADYLRDFALGFWQRFDSAVDAHIDDPRAQLRELFARSSRRIGQQHYRGCGLANAAIEYPQPSHPAHQIVQNTKREVRRRLRLITRALGADEPHLLADGLTMLLEGAYVSRQILGTAGPSRSLARFANRMIDRWPRRKRGKSSPAVRDRR